MRCVTGEDILLLWIARHSADCLLCCREYLWFHDILFVNYWSYFLNYVQSIKKVVTCAGKFMHSILLSVKSALLGMLWAIVNLKLSSMQGEM